MASIPLAEAERGVGSRPAFALFVLFLVGALNILDRNILIILQEPIKADLGLSDTQLGSLTGLSFAIVYCLAGAPIARLADRTVRIRIIAISVAVWSALTATSGAAVNYAQLVLLRMGVATGEAGAFPATLSLLSDYFPLKKRPLAFALWAQCQPVGSALGLLVGGALAATAGWRNTLLIIGLVGIALAPCVMLLREPKRGRFDEGYVPAPPQPAGELVKSFFANKALAWLLAASAMQGFVLFSVQSWSAPLYARVFAVPTEELAFYLSGVIGVAGGVGILLGGVLGRLLVTRSPAWMMLIPGFSAIAAAPLLLGQLLVGEATLSFAFGFFATVSLTAYMSVQSVAAQALVAPNERASVTLAISYAMNLFGLALGPMTVGMTSDFLTEHAGMGADAIKYALLVPVAAAPLAAVCYFRSAYLISRRHALQAGLG